MAAVERDRDQKDLVLGPGSYAFVLDKSKGIISIWSGPGRVTISTTDDTVRWNADSRRFTPVEIENAIQPNILAREGEYVILDNPASSSADVHPPPGAAATPVGLAMGKTTVLHGPTSFALWPLQTARVIPGHVLRSDQYLIVKVADEAAAQANFDKAIIKGTEKAKSIIKHEELTTGRLFIIPGTEVNFYMPCPGLEVLHIDGKFVQEAVTVEAMEYAYLRDQNGAKRYAYGPAVVFPSPTETFVTRTLENGEVVKIFRLIELTETSGLYVKVTADYKETDGTDRKAGDELFITGATTPIYRPRAEHMLIRQGAHEIHYSIAIPDGGSGYYVLNKRAWKDEDGTEHKDGVVELIRGPKTLLINPINQTLTKRGLPLHLVDLMYPGNAEARAVNEERLAETSSQFGVGGAAPVAAIMYTANALEAKTGGGPIRARSVDRAFQGDISNRPITYQKPRSINLDGSKYDGAPRMAIRPGYAVLLVNSIGERRVVKDGEVALLGYDEFPAVLSLSTGTPKSGAKRKHDVYLRTVTKISDQIDLETSDGVKLRVELSYRVRFEGDATKWFDIEDPVGFLTDNLRSRVHHAVSKFSIRTFYADFTAKIRTIVLGEAPAEGSPRPGLTFTENGLHIYDVDVLRLSFEDRSLELLFADAAKATFRDELTLADERRGLEQAKEMTAVSLARAALAADGAEETAKLGKRKADADAQRLIAEYLARAKADEVGAEARLHVLEAKGVFEAEERAHAKLDAEQKHALLVAAHDEEIRVAQAATDAAVARLNAIQPRLIEALEKLGDSALIEQITKHLNVQTILGGTSVSEALSRAFQGTRFANLLEAAPTNGTGNGQPHPAPAQPRGTAPRS